ncbi:MAG: 3-oxoacyl-ACP reductase FabG [Bacteroidales bacterium]|nr:3-oxoacyl-ACP reductase FabG [Bacteroidales bacterium]
MEQQFNSTYPDLRGHSAIVTGGISGIGAAISLELARCGAQVAMIDLKTEEEATGLLHNISKPGGKAMFIKADTSDFTAALNTVQKVNDQFGRIDILVNNAGINRDGVIWKMSEEQWDDVIRVNLKGYFNFTRAVAPIFREQRSGKIVNITSINGLRGKFGQANYSASKAGIIGLTKSVARELGKYNVNVNAIAPGMIETAMVKNAGETVRAAALDEMVLKSPGKPDDIAHLVVFLCSDLARHITGEVIRVDGGQYI